MIISADTAEKYASKDVLPTLKIRAEAHTHLANYILCTLLLGVP